MHPVRKPNPQDDKGHFSVISVTCFPGLRYVETFRVNFTSRTASYDACDRLQDDLDRDGDPARAYVLDNHGIPIRAGRTAFLPANHFLNPQKTRRTAP